MIKFSFLFLVCVSFLIAGKTQQNEQKLYGVVKDSITLTPISDVAIYNSTGKKSSYSGDGGLFQILANQGDTIRYYAPGFFDQSYIVTDKKLQMDTIEIWLNPKIREDLPGVFVSTYTYKDYQADSAHRLKNFVENTGFKIPTFSMANSGAGVGIGLDALFGKKNRQKKKAYEIFKEDEKQRYIDYRFNKILVNHYSGLKGEKLQSFMHDYRPTYEWLRDHTDTESLRYYINDRLKLYFQRPK